MRKQYNIRNSSYSLGILAITWKIIVFDKKQNKVFSYYGFNTFYFRKS